MNETNIITYSNINQNIWLDCDPGNDDFFAIITILTNNFNLLGISTTFGNTTVKNSTNNTLKILSLLGVKNVKVVQGNEFPIIKTNSFSVSEDIHGYNGLGCDLPETDLQPVNSNWIHFMYNTIKNNNKTILVATGPLTNIALLFTIYPDISQSIDKIVLMGGSIGIGNITPSAEANIYHDPEAGKIVFNSGINIVMIPLDVTMKLMIPIDYKNTIIHLNSFFSKKCIEILDFYSSSYKKLYDIDQAPLHDVATIMYLLDPTIFIEKKINVDVDLSHSCKGRTICDFYNINNNTSNVNLVYDINNMKLLWSIFIESIKKANKMYLKNNKLI